MDALGALANTSGNAPQLLFHTVFAGMTLGAASAVGSNRNWIRSFTDSSDSTTGDDIVTDIRALWGSSTSIDIQSIPQTGQTYADATEYAAHINSSLSANELNLEVLQRHGTAPTIQGNPQSLLRFQRSGTQTVASDINEVCFVGYFKLPAGLDLQSGNTNSGRFWEVFAMKTGGYNNDSSIGDLRFKLELLGNNGVNEWVVTVDCAANGFGIVPGLPASSTDVIEYYRNWSGVTAELNVWTKYYVYWNRSAGKLQIAIETDTGNFDLVGNVTPADIPLLNGQLYGVADLNVARIFPLNCYTSANLAAAIKLKELQVWNRPPIKLV